MHAHGRVLHDHGHTHAGRHPNKKELPRDIYWGMPAMNAASREGGRVGQDGRRCKTGATLSSLVLPRIIPTKTAGNEHLPKCCQCYVPSEARGQVRNPWCAQPVLAQDQAPTGLQAVMMPKAMPYSV
eukprot:356684-Chlamydomonas_euryale.AAC.4